MPTRQTSPVPWIGWFVLTITLISGGLMLVEGIYGLSNGRHLLLGAWSDWVTAAGLDPNSSTVNFIFIAYGALLIWLTFAFLRRFGWGRIAFTIALLAGLWYAPIGTTLNVIALVMVYLTPLRDWYAGKQPVHSTPV